MHMPNLLQFVLNDRVANNYLKTNFYLKKVPYCRKVEEKNPDTITYNLKN